MAPEDVCRSCKLQVYDQHLSHDQDCCPGLGMYDLSLDGGVRAETEVVFFIPATPKFPL